MFCFVFTLELSKQLLSQEDPLLWPHTDWNCSRNWVVLHHPSIQQPFHQKPNSFQSWQQEAKGLQLYAKYSNQYVKMLTSLCTKSDIWKQSFLSPVEGHLLPLYSWYLWFHPLEMISKSSEANCYPYHSDWRHKVPICSFIRKPIFSSWVFPEMEGKCFVSTLWPVPKNSTCLWKYPNFSISENYINTTCKFTFFLLFWNVFSLNLSVLFHINFILGNA